MRLRPGGEEGYTIVAVVGSIAVVTLLAGAALAATNGDLNLVRRDLDEKRAFAAAQAGIGDYSFHLNNDNSYWARCTTVPSPHAVNQQGSTTNRRPVPGESDAEYAIELLPATGQSACSPANPVGTMLEQSGPNTGSFRIRATGFVGDTKRSIVATFKRASFLDYIYFTQLETSDPVTYGFPNPSAALTGANTQCTKFLRDGRQSQPIPSSGGLFCTVIVFVSEDEINGPLHTNDALQICGTPTFGRSPADVIEVGAGSIDPMINPDPEDRGWISRCSGGDNPNFVGPFITSAPVLTPPATNGKLKTIAADDGSLYNCQTRITLNGTSMDVRVGNGPVQTVPFPTNGVLYVANDPGPDPCSSSSCSSAYSPFTVTYPSSSPCGNVRVSGTYSGMLTIAAENDIIVEGDIIRTGSGLLGLVANNFVRVRHPICPSSNPGCTTTTAQTSRTNCGGGINGNTGPQPDLEIDAAILSIAHSFIVDHYNCGAPLGTLTVEGAISQKFRGPVGTTSGGSINHGFAKNYTYDDRLRYQEPPNFLDPVESAWHIQRETLDFP
jgi:hypothetical protein